MILKKPYAFLIKYYRLIHFIILFFMGFVAFKYFKIIDFFNTYIANNYILKDTYKLGNDYVSFGVTFFSILILLFSFIIIILLKHKNKPFKTYVGVVAYYGLLFIGFLYLKGVLNGFEYSLMDSTLSRAYRDIIIIIFLPQVIFITLIAIKAFGFNFKEFTFGDQDFATSLNDSEEFELDINIDTFSFKNKLKRFGREFKYYLIENKLILICLVLFTIIVGAFFTIKKFSVTGDTNYAMNRVFVFSNLNINITDSFVSKIDNKGDVIKNNKAYVVVKYNVSNHTNKSINLDYLIFKLKIGNNIINPDIKLNKYFVDYGYDNFISYLYPGYDNDFILTYEIDEKDALKSKSIIISNGYLVNDDDIISKNIFVSLNNGKYYKDVSENVFNLNQDINLNDNFANYAKINVSNYSISDKYYYDTEECRNNDCHQIKDVVVRKKVSGTKLLIIDMVLSLNNDSGDISLKSFANNFVKLEYNIDGQMYSDFLNLTPDNNNENIILEVEDNIENASSIKFIIDIRDNKYIVNLK